MKIAVFSDTHGSVSRLPLIKASLKDIDAVLHLGDLAPDGAKIASELGVPCYAVLGNCDYTHGEPYERVETLGGVRMFLTHGHRYHSLVSSIPRERTERKQRAVAFYSESECSFASAAPFFSVKMA